MLVLVVVLGLAGLLTFGLIVGVRSRRLDDRRNRLVVIGIAALLLAAAFVGVQWWASSEADREADELADRLWTALAGTSTTLLRGEPDEVVFGIGGIDISAMVEEPGRTVLYAPASSLGQDRCVRGSVTTEGRIAVVVLERSCPAS